MNGFEEEMIKKIYNVRITNFIFLIQSNFATGIGKYSRNFTEGFTSLHLCHILLYLAYVRLIILKCVKVIRKLMGSIEKITGLIS
jgi:hypothetical protein